jgi:hypothetical protein
MPVERWGRFFIPGRMAQTSSSAANNDTPAAVSPPAGVIGQLSYSGTPRGPDGSTTPDDYTREMADPVRRMQIFEEMRASDSAVAGAIDARRQEINAANWVLTTEDKSDLGTQILEFVEDNLYPVLDDIIRWVAGGGIQYGFGCVEPVYAWRDAPKAGVIGRGKIRRPARSQMRGIYLEKIAHLRQASIETFKISEQGELETVTQHAFTGSSYRRVEIPAQKTLIWTYDRQGDDRWGVPPTRHCYKAWAFKQQIEKLNMAHTDRFAVGMPVVTAGEGWGARERAAVAEFWRTFRAGTENHLVIPPGGSVTILNDDGTTSASMLEWLKYYDLCIAKTYVTQSSELGSTETGSRAVGDTMVEQLGALVQGDCEDLAPILNGEQLIKGLVDWNYGPQKMYPQFSPSQRVKASGALATMARPLIDAGMLQARPGDEIFVRDSLGLPPIADEAEGENDGEEEGSPATQTDPAAAPIAGQPGVPAPAAAAAAAGAAGGTDQSIQVTESAVLNGAQISSAKDIVLAVVAGQLPRDAGVAMLQVFFNLTPEKAEQIMGSAGTKTPTTPNPVAGQAPKPAPGQQPPPDPSAEDANDEEPQRGPRLAADRGHPHARQLTLAEGGPTPATKGLTWRHPELEQWESRILKPDILLRDLDLQTSRLAGEAQDVLASIDADLEAQASALAADGAAALSAGVRSIEVPETLREQLRTVLYEAAQRSRDYGMKAVRNEIARQLGPEGIGPQRDSFWPATMEAPSFFSRVGARIRQLVASAPDQSPRDLLLGAEVDKAVEEEVSRRESSVRSAMMSAIAQAAGAVADALAEIVAAAANASLLGLSTGRTQSNVQGVVNVGFGIGRSDAADAITDIDGAAQPAGEGSGGGTRSGLRDSDGNAVELVGKIYSAVMDFGTCDECAKWDGAEFSIDYPEDYTGVQCPNPRCSGGYSRCRCVWIYITSRESVPLVPAAKGPEPIRQFDGAALTRELTQAAERAIEAKLARFTPAQRDVAPIHLTVNVDAAKGSVRKTIEAPNGQTFTVTEDPT